MNLRQKAFLVAFSIGAAVGFGGPILGHLGLTDHNKALTRALEGFDTQTLMNILNGLSQQEAEYLLEKIAFITQLGGRSDYLFRNANVSDPSIWLLKDCWVSPQLSDEFVEQSFCREINPRTPASQKVSNKEILDMTLDDLVIFMSTYEQTFPLSVALQIDDFDSRTANTIIENLTLSTQVELPINAVTVLNPSPWEITYSIKLLGRDQDTGDAFELKVEFIEPYDILADQLTSVGSGQVGSELSSTINAIQEIMQTIELTDDQQTLFSGLLERLSPRTES